MSERYPKWWDTTVTVYNKFVVGGTKEIKWYRHVLHNCFWKYAGNKISIGDTILETNNIICRIPKSDSYLPKYEWENLAEDEMSDYFTLGVNDIIVKGEVSTEIDEYSAGQRSSDFLNRFKSLQGCMIIQAVTDNSGIARNNKHYYVSGI